ncbi:MAG: hypothetical protein NVSMB55_27610 [Mycobacteriales bacterium]
MTGELHHADAPPAGRPRGSVAVLPRAAMARLSIGLDEAASPDGDVPDEPPAVAAPVAPPSRRRFAPQTVRISVLMAGLALTGLVLDLLVLRLPAPTETFEHPTLWLLLVAFGLCEAVVLHVELGRNAHSVSLSELALTVALFLLPAGLLAPARILSGCLALLLVRRQRPFKMAFNAALWLCDIAVGLLVFQQLHGALTGTMVQMALPALIAALTVSAVDSLAVNAAIALSSGQLRLDRTVDLVLTTLIGALGCATFGLVCVGALSFAAWLLVPIVLSAALILTGFRMLATLRQQHSSVKVLYDFTRELASSPHGEALLNTVLSNVGELMRADHAAVYLSTVDPAHVLATRSDHGEPGTTRRIRTEDLPARLRVALAEQTAAVLGSATREPRDRRFLSEYAVRDAVLAPVGNEQGLRGVLVVADRHGEVSTFTRDDGLLLQTLASHAGAALANARLVDQLNHDSQHDSLTGLANRAKFQQSLTTALRVHASGFAVLLMDLDRFKEVNDTLGHHHGDLLLQQIAERLSKQLRRGDVLARLGGDEFAVLLTTLNPQEAVASAERLRRALGEPMTLQGVAMEVNASIGIVMAPAHGSDAITLLQRADVAMYSAKSLYGGVQVYEDSLDDYSPRRLALASQLRTGIEGGQLSLRFQPQARIDDAAICGVEALVRWEHPDYGEVPPDDFISLAEQTGQIRELTTFVLEEALRACAGWPTSPQPIAVSVNLSVRNLLEPDLLERVSSALLRHGVPAQQLTLEVTETHLMADPQRTADVLHGLHALGIRISVDDFGTGYSSLAYLKQLPVSEVKVDKSFVRELADDSEDAAIVEAIIQLGHALRLDVVAEGVEDERAQNQLLDLGCDIVQGYHLARPMRNAELTVWLANRATMARRSALAAVPAARAETGPGLRAVR